MSCNIQTLSGLAKDCTPSMGGIVEVYIANESDVTSVTTQGNKVSAITMATSAKFKKYAFNRNTGNLASSYTIDNATGNKFVTNNLVLVFSRMETTKRVEISALAVNDLAVIVKDCNGIYHYLGSGLNATDSPVNMSAGEGGTGTVRADANQYTVTLMSESSEFPYEVEASAVSAVI